MRRVLLLALLFAMAAFSSADEPQSILPKHIQAPRYPVIAKTAHIEGEVAVQVTLDADGKVSDALALALPNLLDRSCVESVRLWTFDRPPMAPFKETVFCDYKLNAARKNAPSEPLVLFDLPNRVTIVATPELVETQNSTH
jgi:TonB family protein